MHTLGKQGEGRICKIFYMGLTLFFLRILPKICDSLNVGYVGRKAMGQLFEKESELLLEPKERWQRIEVLMYQDLNPFLRTVL